MLRIINRFKRVFNCKLSTASSIARFEHDSSDYQHLKYKNGLSLVSLENDSNIVKLSVIHCAGSKHETDENYGITHRIRQSAYLGCKDISYFSLNRILQQLGGNLSIQTDREFIIYNLTCLRENLPKLSKCLFESAFNPGFKSWEIRDSAKFLKFDLEKHEKNIDSLLYEGIHTAAFRNEALGNSLFSTNYKYDSFNTEQMQKYIQSHYSNNNTAIFGDGISQTDLIHLCQENGQIETFHNFSDITTEKTTDITKNFIEPKSKYFGGSLRLGFDCDTVYAIVAGKANSPGTVYSLKGAINQLLLSYIISPPNRVKYSTNYNYPIGKLVAESTNLPYLVENFISIYSDQALVGFSVAVDQKDIEPVLRKSIKALKNLKNELNNKSLEKAKKQVIVDFYDEFSINRNLKHVGLNLFYSDKQDLQSLILSKDVSRLVNLITLEDVLEVAENINSNPLSLVSIGNPKKMPYLDSVQ